LNMVMDLEFISTVVLPIVRFEERVEFLGAGIVRVDDALGFDVHDDRGTQLEVL